MGEGVNIYQFKHTNKGDGLIENKNKKDNPTPRTVADFRFFMWTQR